MYDCFAPHIVSGCQPRLVGLSTFWDQNMILLGSTGSNRPHSFDLLDELSNIPVPILDYFIFYHAISLSVNLLGTLIFHSGGCVLDT